MLGSNVNVFLLGGFISLLGMALLIYGKKATRVPHMVVGLTLMVYPYFIGSLVLTAVIAVVLVSGLVAVSRLGY